MGRAIDLDGGGGIHPDSDGFFEDGFICLADAIGGDGFQHDAQVSTVFGDDLVERGNEGFGTLFIQGGDLLISFFAENADEAFALGDRFGGFGFEKFFEFGFKLRATFGGERAKRDVIVGDGDFKSGQGERFGFCRGPGLIFHEKLKGHCFSKKIGWDSWSIAACWFSTRCLQVKSVIAVFSLLYSAAVVSLPGDFCDGFFGAVDPIGGKGEGRCFDHFGRGGDGGISGRGAKFEEGDLVFTLFLPDAREIEGAAGADIPEAAEVVPIDPHSAEVEVGKVEIGFSDVGESEGAAIERGTGGWGGRSFRRGGESVRVVERERDDLPVGERSGVEGGVGEETFAGMGLVEGGAGAAEVVDEDFEFAGGGVVEVGGDRFGGGVAVAGRRAGHAFADDFAVNHDEGVVSDDGEGEFSFEAVGELFFIEDEAVVLVDVFHGKDIVGGEEILSGAVEERGVEGEGGGGNVDGFGVGGDWGEFEVEVGFEEWTEGFVFGSDAAEFVDGSVVIVGGHHGTAGVGARGEAEVGAPVDDVVVPRGVFWPRRNSVSESCCWVETRVRSLPQRSNQPV